MSLLVSTTTTGRNAQQQINTEAFCRQPLWPYALGMSRFASGLSLKFASKFAFFGITSTLQNDFDLKKQ